MACRAIHNKIKSTFNEFKYLHRPKQLNNITTLLSCRHAALIHGKVTSIALTFLGIHLGSHFYSNSHIFKGFGSFDWIGFY